MHRAAVVYFSPLIVGLYVLDLLAVQAGLVEQLYTPGPALR